MQIVKFFLYILQVVHLRLGHHRWLGLCVFLIRLRLVLICVESVALWVELELMAETLYSHPLVHCFPLILLQKLLFLF